ncbi:MAG: HEPN domain-containing protein [Campylobacterota bacterium]|nr:HEPN domain-containing protein [Campylobacterota bacterium]
MNETAAKEWLTKAWHHYSSGKLLYDAEHYTDVIAVDLHYACEIILKSLLAYDNKKITKTHDLNELSLLLGEYVVFDIEEQRLLALISNYHIKGSYPTPDRKMPTRAEIFKVLQFTDILFYKICELIHIDSNEIKK